MLPLSVVIMLGLMYTGIMMDTAIQEAPRSYYVRREMPVAEFDEPEEPVMMVESEEPRDSVVNPLAEEPERQKPVKGEGFEKIHNLLHSVDRSACMTKHVLKGENAKEPDVHVCLDNIVPPCVVYSFGIAYNWIFDDFMIAKGCNVFSFDPSMDMKKHKRHVNHLFEPIGIGPMSGMHTGKSTLYGGKTNYSVLSLQDMMQRFNHTHIDMIRMDVESAEWDVLQSWTEKNMWERIDQLLLEIHMYGDEHMHADALMNVPMTLFHVARNLWNNKRIIHDMTQVYELGFRKAGVHRKTVSPSDWR